MIIIIIICSNIRWYITVSIRLRRPTTDEEEDEDELCKYAYLSHPSQGLLHADDIDDQLDSVSEMLTARLSELTDTQGSGWCLEQLYYLELSIAAYDSILGSTYIKTPKSISKKRAVLNIENKDDRCFLYSVLAAIYPQKTDAANPLRYRRYLEKLNFKGLTFPLPLNQISKFESMNQTISITVVYMDPDERSFYSVRVSPFRDRKHQVTLLLLEDPKRDIKHYVLVTSLSALLNTRSRCNRKCHVCPYCLHRFYVKSLLDAHIDDCGKNKPLVIEFPSKFVKTGQKTDVKGKRGRERKNVTQSSHLEAEELEVRAYANEHEGKNGRDPPNILKFTNVIKTFPQPFVIYCDFESFVTPDGERDKHVPSGVCCLTVSILPQFNTAQPFVYSGEDVMEAFFDHLLSEEERIESILSENNAMKPLTYEQLLHKETVTQCESCGKIFDDNRYKVSHHQHLTGEFICVTCNPCNLQLKPRKVHTGRKSKNDNSKFSIPVVFHNLTGYDSHH